MATVSPVTAPPATDPLETEDPATAQSNSLIAGTLGVTIFVVVIIGSLIYCCKRLQRETSEEGRAARKAKYDLELQLIKDKTLKEAEEALGAGVKLSEEQSKVIADSKTVDYASTVDAESAIDGASVLSPSPSKKGTSVADDSMTVMSTRLPDDDSNDDGLGYQALLGDDELDDIPLPKMPSSRRKHKPLRRKVEHVELPPARKSQPFGKAGKMMVSGVATRKPLANFGDPQWQPDEEASSMSRQLLYNARYDPHETERQLDAVRTPGWSRYVSYAPKEQSTFEDSVMAMMPKEEREKRQAELAADVEKKTTKPLPVLPAVTPNAFSKLRPLAQSQTQFFVREPTQQTRMTSVAPNDFIL